MNKIFILLILLFCSFMSVLSSEPPATEIRAVWLTTNYGLDWPRNRTSQESQKRELINILDENVEEINDIIKHVKSGRKLQGKDYTNGNMNREI